MKKTLLKKYLYLLTLVFFVSNFVLAQPPAEYYLSADGLKTSELKDALHLILKDHIQLSYGSLPDYFKSTDMHPDGYYWDMYSNTKRTSYSGMNREHSFPKSWWGGTKNAAYSDIMHLYPTDITANSRRSNYPLGEVGVQSWTNGAITIGKNSYPGGYVGDVFEPGDEYKGDLARTFFYMVTCYQNFTWKGNAVNFLDQNTYPVFKPWAIEMLLKWHREDPVSEKETNRNNEVYKIQENRNPFIDYPELAEYIWGNKTDQTFYLDNEDSEDVIVTIAELKNKFEANSPTLIEDPNLVLRARVSANDESGNIYKQLYVQDATGGITISIDATGLSSLFKVGQEMYLRMDGLYIGKYGGEYQIGTLYNGVIGRMTLLDWEARVSTKGTPNPEHSEVLPRVISIADISSLDPTTIVNTLIRIEGVTFNNGGVNVFAPADGPNANEEYVAQNGVQLMVRTSKYANFATDILPSGTGVIEGIMGRYNGTWQFTLRDRNDLIDFTGEIVKGTKENPYSIEEAIEKKTTDDSKVWIKGFIVGTVASGVNLTNPIDNNNDIVFSGSFMDNTVVLADNANETDYRKLVVVQLPSGSSIRNTVNLFDTPGNKGKELLVQGTLVDYFGAVSSNTPGDVNDYVFERIPVGDGDGSKENPYTTDQVAANLGQTGQWVKGYIVGNIDGAGMNLADDANFAAPFTIKTNLLIAATPDETNPAYCITVQLPAGNVRSGLNLVDNTSNLSQLVMVYGDLATYFGVAGVRAVSDYVLGSVVPPTDEVVFDETLTTVESYNTFTPINVIGDLAWYFNTTNPSYGAIMSGYGEGVSHENEDWLISPAVDLAGKISATLTFDHARGPAGSMNIPTSNYTLWISDNYTGGMPSTATWTQLAIPTFGAAAWSYVSSGDIAIPAAYLTENIRIAFKYVCNDAESATWEVKNVKITAVAGSSIEEDSQNDIKVYYLDGNINIYIGDKSEDIDIYTILGRKVVGRKSVSGTSVIPVEKDQIYIVKVGNKVSKILTK